MSTLDIALKFGIHGEGIMARPYKDSVGLWTWGIGRCYERAPFTGREIREFLKVCGGEENGRDFDAYPWNTSEATAFLDNAPQAPLLSLARIFHVRRIEEIDHELTNRIPGYLGLNDARQAVLIDMAYNLGVAGLLQFRMTLKSIREGQWEDAKVNMLDSQWAVDVGANPPSDSNPDGQRAWYLSETIRTGIAPKWATS